MQKRKWNRLRFFALRTNLRDRGRPFALRRLFAWSAEHRPDNRGTPGARKGHRERIFHSDDHFHKPTYRVSSFITRSSERLREILRHPPSDDLLPAIRPKTLTAKPGKGSPRRDPPSNSPSFEMGHRARIPASISGKLSCQLFSYVEESGDGK